MTRRLLSLIVLYAALLHLLWAFLYVFWPVAANATPLHGVFILPVPGWAIVVLMVGSSLLAFRIVFIQPEPSRNAGIMLIPQALLVLLAAFGAGHAIWTGHYADGVMRHRAFIAADQMHPILLLIFHQIAFGSYLGPLTSRFRTWKG